MPGPKPLFPHRLVFVCAGLFLLFLCGNARPCFGNPRSLDSLISAVENQLVPARPETIKEWYAQVLASSKSARFQHTDKASYFLHFANLLPDQERAVALAKHRLIAQAGNVFRKKGRFADAVVYFDQALVGFEALDERSAFVGTVNHFSGTIYTRQGDFERAITRLQQALAIRLELENWEGAASIYSDLGVAFFTQENHAQALAHYQQGLALPEISLLQQANLLLNAAGLQHATGQSHSADSLNDQAYQRYHQLPEPYALGIVESLKLKGELAISNGNISQAQQHFREALQWAAQTDGRNLRETAQLHLGLADCYERTNAPEAGLKHCQMALSILIPGFEGISLLDNPPDQEVPPEPWILVALEQKARLWEQWFDQKNNPEYLHHAIACLQLAVNHLELLQHSFIYSSSKKRILNAHYALFPAGIRASQKLKGFQSAEASAQSAWWFATRAKAALLSEELAVVKNSLLQQLPDSLHQRECYLRIRMEELKYGPVSPNNSAQLQTEKQAYETLMVQLQERYPNFRNSPRTVPNAFQVQQRLEPDELLLNFVWGDSLVWGLAWSQEKQSCWLVGKSAELKHEVATLRNLLQTPPHLAPVDQTAPRFQDLAFSLYQNLLAPALDSAQNIHKLAIIPDGLLWSLSFETLLTEPSSAQSFSTQAYLLRNYLITYQHSLAFWHDSIPPSTASTKEILAMAFGPDLGLSEEISAIEPLFSGDYLKGKAASKQAFFDLHLQKEILHLAAHARTDFDHPGLSALYLAPKNDSAKHDALRVYELYGLELSSRLTVLSACETGVGSYQHGEGILSLARGFVAAGCPNLVLSLWPVDHHSTTQLMTGFYSEVALGKPFASALRTSKLNYLKSADPLVSHPYFWAGFAFTGNASAQLPEPESHSLLLGLFLLVFLAFVTFLVVQKYRPNKRVQSK